MEDLQRQQNFEQLAIAFIISLIIIGVKAWTDHSAALAADQNTFPNPCELESVECVGEE